MTTDFRDGPLVVVAIDPGGFTGIAVLSAQVIVGGIDMNTAKWGRLTLGPAEHHRALYRFLELQRTHNYVIICESFRDRPNKDFVQLNSSEYIGVVKLYSQNE